MNGMARLLVAASGAILIALGFWYGLAAVSATSGITALTVLIGLYAVALIAVGAALIMGRANRVMLALSVALPAIPLVVIGLRFVTAEASAAALPSPSLWLLPLAGLVLSALAVLVRIRERRHTPYQSQH